MCSYLLIDFWFTRPITTNACQKTFLIKGPINILDNEPITYNICSHVFWANLPKTIFLFLIFNNKFL